MRIAVLSETDSAEPRVAAVPETVKKFKALGADVVVQSGAGTKAGIPDGEYEAAGATVAGSAEDAARDADLVLKVRRPAEEELKLFKSGTTVIAIMDPYGNEQALKASPMPPLRRLRDGADAPHHPRAGHGRALLAGEPRRLPRGGRRRRGIRPCHADDDDRGRHRAGGPCLRDGRRRRRPPGHRDRPPPRRRRDRDGRPSGHEGAGRIARREVRRRRGRRVQAGRDGRRLRQGMSAEYQKKQAELVKGHIAKQDIVITTALIPAARRRSSSPKRWWPR